MTKRTARGLQPSYARERLGELAGDGAGWHEVDGWPIAITVRLTKAPDGRLGCSTIVLDGFPDVELTSRLLRSIALGEVVTEAAGAGEGGGEIIRWLAQSGAAEAPARTRPGPSGYSSEHYELVAEKYRQALEVAPRAPIPWLKGELHASEPTIRRWVQRARDRGLLGPSIPGKAGEAPTEGEAQ